MGKKMSPVVSASGGSAGGAIAAQPREPHQAALTSQPTSSRGSAMTPEPPRALDSLIIELCARTPGGRTICPTDAAKAFAESRGEDEMVWRSHLSAVRHAAVRLALEGRLVITRKGKIVDPKDFRGVYRLGAPSNE
jgi:hypothetical protein